eukprot:GHVU01235302.1.p1 GENE.GHVU01235302.1~~GHVU01235302.1.p1  ORF type:complete len:104 (-),score=3.86 GHVU01235302.1:143-454(-)
MVGDTMTVKRYEKSVIKRFCFIEVERQLVVVMLYLGRRETTGGRCDSRVCSAGLVGVQGQGLTSQLEGLGHPSQCKVFLAGEWREREKVSRKSILCTPRPQSA